MIPEYSVLMSVYGRDRADWFRAAVQSMLDQTIPPKEFVLVCDGPLGMELEDVVDVFLREYPDVIQTVRLPENRGLGYALQQGLLRCRCEFVARMDADDIAVKDRVERQLAVMAAQTQISVVGGQIAEFTEKPEQVTGYRVVPVNEKVICTTAAFRNPMNHVTVVFRRQDVLDAGGYRDFPGFEDYDLWARMLRAGKHLLNLQDVLCFVRINEDTYRRRGGLSYFRNAVAMQKELRRCGLVTRVQYGRNLVVRCLGTVFLPAGLRGWLFRTCMRKRTPHETGGN
ncbi:MAG: glycosyltransferase [Oscillibacter sp.]|nr:glycosyltransferase [Oscillibacter sp.]